ncbi:hypothetical protein C8Q75DRAFT_483300 [Abortiporus biennis]|nr:hypothetical protein C8Q75DRAFT_483300 [Abortiporus biennis]
MGLLTIVYGVECVLVTSFFGHYTLHIVKTSDQKWSWIKNAQESKHFRFLSPMHLVAIPLAWTLWSIVIFMTYLVLLFLAIGTEPPANDSNPTLSLPMQIMGPVMLVITVSYIIFALFSFIRLSMASNHHCLPLTRFDDPHCGTPPSQPPSDPPIPNGPSPDINQPPHPPPNDTNSSTRGMSDHSQADDTADPTSSL